MVYSVLDPELKNVLSLFDESFDDVDVERQDFICVCEVGFHFLGGWLRKPLATTNMFQ